MLLQGQFNDGSALVQVMAWQLNRFHAITWTKDDKDSRCPLCYNELKIAIYRGLS